jgi:hypothetical protein
LLQLSDGALVPASHQLLHDDPITLNAHDTNQRALNAADAASYSAIHPRCGRRGFGLSSSYSFLPIA